MKPEPLKLQIPEKLAPFLIKNKRYKIAYGGRGGAKSTCFADLFSHKVQVEGSKVGCLREYQNSLDDSVYSLLVDEINRLGIPGFKVLKNRIEHKSGGVFKFKGLSRSIDSVKSMHGFKYFWLEEGQFISKGSLKILTPTLRESGSELWISANTMSREDAFSQRFIVPFEDELEKNGIYEDDLHYIVKVNYYDNPWFPDVLEQERLNDFKTLSRAEYDHVWLGAYNDSVENTIIEAEWFDACIDAHKNLGFKALGAKIASYDPADTGPDPSGFAFRHGSVLLDLKEFNDGDVNESCDWATGLAIEHGCDIFSWDCDGLGVSLNRQINDVFEGKHTVISQFKGSEKVDFPKSIFEPASKVAIFNQKTNEEALKNKRAQYYLRLRDRVYNTYRAVAHGEYKDPDTMISFSSDIKLLPKFRSELCRIPKKPNANGFFELYTKLEMRSKFRVKSPNLADSVMMGTRIPITRINPATVIRPEPCKVIALNRGAMKREPMRRANVG